MAFLNDRKFELLRLPKPYIEKIKELSYELNINKSRVMEFILEDYLVNTHKNLNLNRLLESLNDFDSCDPVNKEVQPIKDALIIAGGIGSRLKPFTQEIVKPLVPVHGKPVAEYLVELFRHYGVENIYFSVCYKPDQIKSYFGDGSRYGMNFYYLHEPEDKPMGTAYALRLLRSHDIKGPVFVSNADELKDVNLKEFANQHYKTGADVTIALTEVKDPSAYGVAKMKGKNNQIIEFVEKPPKSKAPSKFINSGMYIANPSVFEMIPDKKTMMEKEIFPIVAKDGKMFGYKFFGQWFDTGTPERYMTAIENWQGYFWGKNSKK